MKWFLKLKVIKSDWENKFYAIFPLSTNFVTTFGIL